MKKILISALICFTLISFFSIQSCKKDDAAAPSIQLTGGSTVTQSLPAAAGGGSWTDPGYSASDNEDGDLTGSVTVSGTVNANRKGTYSLTYSVSDKAGNPSSVTRTVNIVNDAEVFVGAYNNSVDSCTLTPPSNFVANVFTSDSVNSLVKIKNFGAFDATGTYLVYAKLVISPSSITISTPQFVGVTATIDLIFPLGTGIISPTAPTKFKINYKWSDGIANDICTSYYIR